MQPVRVQVATTLCSTRAHYAGKLAYWYRAPQSAASESRTRRRLPHLIARQFNNLQVRHVSLRSRECHESKCQVKNFLPQVVHARDTWRCRSALTSFRIVARIYFTTGFPSEIARRSRFATSIASLLFVIYIFNYVRPKHPSLTALCTVCALWRWDDHNLYN